jgi:hypothetical protein
MRMTKWMFTYLFAALCTTLVAAQSDEQGAAKAAAVAWIARADAADYAATWETAAAVFKASITVDAWTQAVRSVRDPLGAVQSRAEGSITMATSLPGVPDGNYAVLQYTTAFANKAAAVETVVLALDTDSQWKVAGYFIK